MNATALEITSCPCEYCGVKIEFAAAASEDGQIIVECPACKMETRLHAPRRPSPIKSVQGWPLHEPVIPQPRPLPLAKPAMKPTQWASWPHTSFATLLFVASWVLFLIGGALVIEGVMGGVKADNAIAQIYFAISYCAGFCIGALSLILAALAGLLTKR